jgi:hypothetical protein
LAYGSSPVRISHITIPKENTSTCTSGNKLSTLNVTFLYIYTTEADMDIIASQVNEYRKIGSPDVDGKFH